MSANMTHMRLDAVEMLRRDAARYRWLAERMTHVSHPNGDGWTLTEVIPSNDRDLGDVIDAAIAQERAK